MLWLLYLKCQLRMYDNGVLLGVCFSPMPFLSLMSGPTEFYSSTTSLGPLTHIKLLVSKGDKSPATPITLSASLQPPHP